MINSNWHPISYRFRVIAAYCLNFAPTRSLWLKILRRRGRPPPIIFAPIVRTMNALQRCSRQFSHTCYGWGATSENISKIGDFTPTRSFWSQISGIRGRPPPIIFVRLVRPMNALQVCFWQFSHRCYSWGATSENRAKIGDYWLKIGDFVPTGVGWPKISRRRGRPHQPFFFSEN